MDSPILHGGSRGDFAQPEAIGAIPDRPSARPGFRPVDFWVQAALASGGISSRCSSRMAFFLERFWNKSCASIPSSIPIESHGKWPRLWWDWRCFIWKSLHRLRAASQPPLGGLEMGSRKGRSSEPTWLGQGFPNGRQRPEPRACNESHD